jgi:outer membrane lipoprotein-sorting protein
MINFLLIYLFFLFGANNDIVTKLQEKFEKIQYMKADFSQISESKNSISGKFYYAKENKYRIELPNNIIISDGQSIWNNDIKRNKVIISNIDEDPLAFSLRQYMFEYPSKCKITEEKVKNGYLLFLDASDTELNFKSAKLWITVDYLIEKILVIDFADNPFTLQFNNISLLNSIDENLFEFKNKDIKVIDLR